MEESNLVCLCALVEVPLDARRQGGECESEKGSLKSWLIIPVSGHPTSSSIVWRLIRDLNP